MDSISILYLKPHWYTVRRCAALSYCWPLHKSYSKYSSNNSFPAQTLLVSYLCYCVSLSIFQPWPKGLVPVTIGNEESHLSDHVSNCFTCSPVRDSAAAKCETESGCRWPSDLSGQSDLQPPNAASVQCGLITPPLDWNISLKSVFNTNLNHWPTSWDETTSTWQQ